MALTDQQLEQFANILSRVDAMPFNTSSVNQLLGWMNSDGVGHISVSDLRGFMAELDYHSFDTNKIRRLLSDISEVTGLDLDHNALMRVVGTRISDASEMETLVNYALTGQLPSPQTPARTTENNPGTQLG